MKHGLFWILIILAITVKAEETVTRYELDLIDFIDLKVTDGINVDYICSQDSAGKAVFETVPELASQIIFVPKNDKLEIQLATSESGGYKNLPTIKVYSNFLNQAENAGDSLLRIISVAPAAKFKIKLIGNGMISARNVEVVQLDASINTGKGMITVNGKAQTANFKTTGSGSIQADGLIAKTVKCSLMGTGSIGCTAEESLSIMGAGSGHVYYKGNPVIKNRSIGVKVSEIE